MNTRISLFLLFVLSSVIGFAQGPINEPKDPKLREEAAKYNVLYFDDMQAEKYQQSANALGWLIRNVPNYSEDMYKGAAKVYPKLIEKLTNEKGDKKVIDAYQDTLILSFENRAKFFGKEPYVMNFKGFYAYQYYATRPEKMEDLYNTYKKIAELNGNKTYYYNAHYYMIMVCNMKVTKKIDTEQGFKDYEIISNIIDDNIQNNEKEKAQWEKTKEEVNTLFSKYFPIDCEFIKNNLSKKFKENKTKEEAEKLKKYLISAECYTDDLFLEVMEITSKDDQSCGNMMLLGKLYESKGDLNKAKEYYGKAAENCGTGVEKGKAYKEIAEIETRIGAKASAKHYAIKMMQADPNQTSWGYTIIGNLYLGSGSDCPSDNKVHAKAYAIAAYDAYKKAGNTEKMALAKKYFPTKDEIFFANLNGQSYTLPCWIGETVTYP